MPTMYSMSLAGGLTDDRALLCSVSQSSINFPSVISGSHTEHTPEFRRIQTNSNISTVPLMLQTINQLWFVKFAGICQTRPGTYTLERNRMCVWLRALFVESVKTSVISRTQSHEGAVVCFCFFSVCHHFISLCLFLGMAMSV